MANLKPYQTGHRNQKMNTMVLQQICCISDDWHGTRTDKSDEDVTKQTSFSYSTYILLASKFLLLEETNTDKQTIWHKFSNNTDKIVFVK